MKPVHSEQVDKGEEAGEVVRKLFSRVFLILKKNRNILC